MKKWFLSRYMPAYAKAKLAENEKFYQKKIAELEQENKKLKAYIAGLETGLKAAKKIQIYTSRGES